MAVPDEYPESTKAAIALADVASNCSSIIAMLNVSRYTLKPMAPTLPDRLQKAQRRVEAVATKRAFQAERSKQYKLPRPDHRTRNPQTVRR